MDDQFYLAVYDEKRIQPLIHAEDYVCDVVLPSYRFCEVNGIQGICKERFSEVAVKLYQLDENLLSDMDGLLAPELVRHQAMAADEERLYNVYVYVAEIEEETDSQTE